MTGFSSASVCASVKLQIDQEVTFERQGFEARMNISNPGLLNLQDLQVTVNFADAEGNPVIATSDPNHATAKFFIKLTSSPTLPAFVAGGTVERLRWLIVPAASAGSTATTGVLYQVGAAVSYKLGGIETHIDVSPDSIRVKPMPMLALDYFLPGDVYGDDPFTPEIETPIPFSLGVRVGNTGAGIAGALKIESSQPRIIENQQGLAVRFQIEGSEVNGLPAGPSLLADFGNIGPGAAGMGRWQMTSSLDGKFTGFAATFSHDDGLGGKLTSLISEVRTHELVRDVIVDLPGRDSVRDFLALDADGLRVYDSQNNDETVSDRSERAFIVASGRSFTVTQAQRDPGGGSPPLTGFSYLRVLDPLAGAKDIYSVTRGDGKVIPASNAWLSSTYLAEEERREYHLNIFDTNNARRLPYTVMMGAATGINHAPILRKPLPLFTVAGVPLAMSVSGSDPDGDEVTLTSGTLPAGAAFNSTGPGAGRLEWTPTASQQGVHSFEFTVSDGELTDRKTVLIGVMPAGSTQLANWQEFFWRGITDAAVTGLNADPDGDGLVNLIEFMFGMDPTSGDLTGQPQVTTVHVGGSTYLAILFNGRQDDAGGISGLSTDNLTGGATSWQVCQDKVPQDQSDVPSGFERIMIRDYVPIGPEAPKRFMRLKVAVDAAE